VYNESNLVTHIGKEEISGFFKKSGATAIGYKTENERNSAKPNRSLKQRLAREKENWKALVCMEPFLRSSRARALESQPKGSEHSSAGN